MTYESCWIQGLFINDRMTQNYKVWILYLWFVSLCQKLLIYRDESVIPLSGLDAIYTDTESHKQYKFYHLFCFLTPPWSLIVKKRLIWLIVSRSFNVIQWHSFSSHHLQWNLLKICFLADRNIIIYVYRLKYNLLFWTKCYTNNNNKGTVGWFIPMLSI